MAHDVTNIETPRRGLALPALREAGGYFASKTRFQVAWGDLLIALLCPIQGRFMNRSFGSGLHRVLFEPGVADNPQLIEYMVTDAAARHCPSIVIRSVDTVADGDVVDLRVNFSLVEDSAVEQKLVRLARGVVVRTP
jgi:phage baseplate assembly protein W